MAIRLTVQSAAEFELAVGAPVVALVKAPNVPRIAREGQGGALAVVLSVRFSGRRLDY